MSPVLLAKFNPVLDSQASRSHTTPNSCTLARSLVRVDSWPTSADPQGTQRKFGPRGQPTIGVCGVFVKNHILGTTERTLGLYIYSTKTSLNHSSPLVFLYSDNLIPSGKPIENDRDYKQTSVSCIVLHDTYVCPMDDYKKSQLLRRHRRRYASSTSPLHLPQHSWYSKPSLVGIVFGFLWASTA
jgi:hypothetical protein